LVDANARLQLSTSVAQVGGPAAAGGLVGFLSAPAAILIDSVSYLISAFFLSHIQFTSPTPDPALHEHWRLALGAGGRVIRSNRRLGRVLASAMATAFFGQIFFTVLALFLTSRIGAGPLGVGFILTIGGIGATAASTIASIVPRRIGVGRTILLSQAFFGLSGFLLIGAFFTAQFATVFVALSMFFQWGFNTLRAVNAASLVQLHTPINELGRTQATVLFALSAAELLGSLAAGGLGAWFEVSAIIVVAEIGMASAIIPLLWRRVEPRR
jgi:predicted MFS family arabinose efflux permease